MAVHHHHHQHSIAYHVQARIRLMLAPTSMPLLFCGSMLVMLALVSLTIGPILDLDIRLMHHESHYIPADIEPQFNQSANVSQPYVVNIDAPEIVPETIWESPYAKLYTGCSSPSNTFPTRVSSLESNGYIYVETSGGLNQQRVGIIDAVLVSRILNATLIVPFLDHDSFWKDNSNFSDIFDVDWFIASLAPDVNIMKEIPSRLKITRDMLYGTRAPRRSEPEHYTKYILPLLKRKKAIRLTKFDYRLSSDLDEELQKLRCRVNYSALRFTSAIANMANTIVRRLKQKGGRYIALHLRFERDMLAFTGCYYFGGEKVRQELNEIRKRWTTLSPKLESEPRSGKCPLTPEEVGLMLKALGFPNDSHIYVASGEVYGGEENLAPLRALFPNFHTKESLTTYHELEPFMPYTNRMAAIDYIVCEESDVFITNYNGNMAKVLAGTRRYHGHKRTIQPNVKKLGSLFQARPNLTWKAFSTKLRHVQRGFIGEPNELRPGGEFFEFPNSCICRKQQEIQNEMEYLPTENKHDEKEREANSGNSDSGPDITEEEILYLQQADLLNEFHAGVNHTESKELDEVSWFSD